MGERPQDVLAGGRPLPKIDGMQPTDVADADDIREMQREIAAGKKKVVQDKAMRQAPKAMAKLDKMIGMDPVKKQVQAVLATASLRDARKREGLPVGANTMNMVFEGNPGVGKTETAQIVAEALHEAGITRTDTYINTSANQLKGEAVGESAGNMQRAFDQARGGVMFVDEVTPWTQKKNTYGQESMETLMKLAEDNRDDVVVILGGYPKTRDDLRQVNPGLPRRFPQVVEFPDYTSKQKFDIGMGMMKEGEYRVTPAARKKYMAAMEVMEGQGGDVRTFHEFVLQGQGERFGRSKKSWDRKTLQRITPADVDYAIARYRDQYGEPLQLER